MTPVLFISHGSPAIALDRGEYGLALAAWASELPRPAALVVFSAHWEAAVPVRITSSERPRIVYDFGGFPEPLYQLQYACAGSPALAVEIAALLSGANIPATIDLVRGLDHGVWIPLRFLYPAANVPVVSVALPLPRTPRELIAIGAALAPLRERNVLLIGSGGIVHNLRRIVFDRIDAPVDEWAREFDNWVRDRLEDEDLDALADYRRTAPYAELAVPEPEHFDPLFAVLGARGKAERPKHVYEGFQYGNLSMRCTAFGA